jgi:isocitrate lyase
MSFVAGLSLLRESNHSKVETGLDAIYLSGWQVAMMQMSLAKCI